MIEVKKDGYYMALSDHSVLDAFLNNGWTLVESKNSVVKNDIQSEVKVKEAEKKYSKTEINRMSTLELKELAKAEGIADSENLSGMKLKSTLIEHFGL